MNENIKDKISFVWQHKIVEYLSYITIALIPLYFNNNHLYIFNSPKIIIMAGISILMVVFFLWGNWKIDEFKIKFSFLKFFLLFFLLALTISSILGIDPINSFFGWRNVMPLVAMYVLGGFALIAGFLIEKDKKVAVNLLSISLLTSFFVIIVFYLGLVNPKYYMNEGSTLGNSSYLGGYILFNFFFGVGLFLYFKTPWKKILIAVASLFIVINPLFINKMVLLGKVGISEIFHNPMVLLGIANGATMGIGLSIIFICFLFMVFSSKKWIKISGLILIVVFLFGIIFTGRELVNTGTNLNKVFTEEKSGNRFMAWDVARQGFLENPIFGNGYNNYIYNSDKYHSTLMYQKGYLVERLIQPHNVFWEFASNTGIVGLVGYLGLLAVLFVTLLSFKNKEEDRRLKNLRIVLAGIILGYFIQNLFVFDTISTYLMLFLLVSIGLGLSHHYGIEIDKKFNVIKKILTIISILFCLWMIYVLVITPWKESSGRVRILGKNKVIDMAQSVKTREGLGDTIFSGVMDSTYQADNLFLLYQNALSKVNENNKKSFLLELESIVYDLEKGIKKQPYFSESYLAISKILNLHLMIEMKEGKIVRFNGTNYNKDVWDKSYASITKSLELNNNNPQTYLVLSQLYMLRADFKNAYLYNKIAMDMAPEFPDSYSFGKFLLKVNPNKDFENYINKMESKWILK